MKIILASDHGGFELKEQIKSFLTGQGFNIEDVGTHTTSSVDYPVVIKSAIPKILANKQNRGIFVCGTGLGVSIMANRTKGIRAAVVHSEPYAQLCRSHNDANVLCLGGRFLSFDEAKTLINIFFETPFMGDQHLRRVTMLDNNWQLIGNR